MYNRPNFSLEDIKALLSREDLEEEPVPLDRFVTDPYYLGLSPLSPVQTAICEKMTQIFHEDTLIKLYGEEKGRKMWEETVNEVICQIGKGGGKDFTLRIAFARIIYLLHCLKNPLSYYGLNPGEYIDLLNIALNSEQAQRVFFDPLKNMLINSPYFQRKGFMPMSKKIEFLERPIRCFSGHSEAEGWEGFNLIAVTLDEISAFKMQDESGATEAGSAKAIYDMARLSVVSRFPDVGKIALLSFPRHRDDFIQLRYNSVIKEKRTRKVKKNIGPIDISWEEDEIISYSEPKVWAIKCPTFVANPTKKAEDFVSDFIRDPVKTEARILCNPPEAVEAFFRDTARLRACFHVHKEPCNEKYCVKPPWDENGLMPPTFRDPDGPLRYIHIDLGLKRDRSALCMVHCSGFVKSDHDEQVMPIIKMDLIKYWEAPPGGEVDFNDVRRFVFALASRFPVAMITIDRWQSIDTKNIFEAKGLPVEFMSVKKTHYDTLSTTIYDGRLKAYYDPILVDEELARLQLIRGVKVDHPKTGFKDGADALAGAVFTCTSNSYVEEVIDIEVIDENWRNDTVDQEKTEVDKPQDIVQRKEMPDDLKSFLDGMGMI